MSDAANTTVADTTVATQTWFTGLDAEHVGHVQTKGWDKLAPEAAAVEIAKAHRAAELRLGVPAEQILRLPKDTGDVEGWKAVWSRLGAPAKPEEYDFKAVEFDDAGLTTKFQDALRAAAVKLNMPKQMAEEFAKAAYDTIGSHGESVAAEEAAALVAERGKLFENWGPEEGTRFKGNMFVADRAAERLGVTPEVMEKLKDGIGGAAVAELFRTIGAGMGEDKLITDPGQGGRDVMTRDQAVARKAELLGDGRVGSGDTAFQDRYMKGDVAARREVDALTRLIVGV